ncbi:adhesion G protein-coupled receptor L3-like [Xenentodon cancila]
MAPTGHLGALMGRWASLSSNAQDVNECEDTPAICGSNTDCFNTNGSYYCQCLPGFKNVQGTDNFTAADGQCMDINECIDDKNVCGPSAKCRNMIGSYHCTCMSGYIKTNNSRRDGECEDVNECEDTPAICGSNTNCFNTNGSYYCQCLSGFKNVQGTVNFTAVDGQCMDINECIDDKNVCGPSAKCRNMIGSYDCTCMSGYIKTNNSRSYGECEDINECTEAENVQEHICGEKGTCKNINGSYWCVCPKGYTNYGNDRTPCSPLNCTGFSTESRPAAMEHRKNSTSPLFQHTFGLQVVTKIGLIISLVFLVLSILTFKFCRSIQGTRTTVHLHLCICLFMADLVFLSGISQIKPESGCRFVAALLHFFFLGVFTWMLLEGVQLYHMVVLVFNATIRPLYLYVTGYGIPLVIVTVSAIVRPKGYGTDQHCWLSLKDGLIWSFFGPVFVIIILNVFLFITTGWKLAQKFTSLNPDLSKLQKTRAFTVTAIGQVCILHLMWVFGSSLFREDTTVVAYVFTVLNSLQGVLVFIMLCLLSKQVREEYVHVLSYIYTPHKSSRTLHGSRSGQHTGESQI